MNKERMEQAMVDIYTNAISLAQNGNQIVGEDNEYFITLEQLSSLLKLHKPVAHMEPDRNYRYTWY